MPWLMAEGNANGYAANYKSDNGGSLLNYLWLASGSCHGDDCTLHAGTHDFNCTGNDCYFPHTTKTDAITDDTIVRELNNAGMSWKVYAQSYAAAGGTVTTPDNANNTSYYRRHNGAMWYSDVLDDQDGSASKVVDLSQLAIDVADGTLPRFIIIVPDGNHDAHDCPVGMSKCSLTQKLAAADTFLSDTLNPILQTSDFQPGGDGLIIVTFDECGGGTNSGCGAAVYTALIGPKVKPHTISKVAYKHENTLRTILESLQISTYPGAAKTAAAMSDFFDQYGGKPVVNVSLPVDGAQVASPAAIQASAVPTAGHTISGWYIFVDQASVYNTGAVNAISTNVKMSDGPHTVVVRAWDSSGAFGDQTLSVTVAATVVSVTVSTPSDGAKVGAPVNVQASAAASVGHTISGWWIYVDGLGVYDTGAVGAINTHLGMNPGAHTLLVRAWDTSGAYGDKTVKVTISDKPAVAVSVPAPGSNVNSPINIQASATPSGGYAITGWNIYLDGIPVHPAGGVETINANVSASVGSHAIVVRAWESSGAYGDQTLTVQVHPIAVNISTPLDAASVSSPVKIQATASSAHNISGWHVYVDSVNLFGKSTGDSINTSLAMGSGVHSILVRAWDSTGTFGDETIKVTVP